ncbi:Di-copper centre-containing protein [Bimuria novae-zelandiae CBS 107.79]|uniref:Di-copper centre-containing protein n=1 Tax=Bimuria novae-zelandiae CBS 107.79 TaxID=1447943 RepID=A0A6A5VP72_9PLEO|nr:Di-copper centre-containing protein [Bimuria novae-zelandiae CBS 107.79]
MHLFHTATVQLLAAWLVIAAPVGCNASTIDIDAATNPVDALAQLQQHAYETLKQREGVSKRTPKGCSLVNTVAYINAVKCLQTLPSKSDPAWALAAKTRFDDFVAIHVNKTMYIHGNGLFLTCHRYFVWSYEQALRNECGYTGYQPYWNWFARTDDIYKSPVFDGSDASMGGDGVFFSHNGSLAGARTIFIPSSAGGGCIESGPFVNVQANIGPISPGMHTSGHYTMGGDPTDLYSFVNDPAFWLHHTMLDHIYWVWQVLHPAEAEKVVGTLTLQNKPPTRDATVDEELELGSMGRRGGLGLCLIRWVGRRCVISMHEYVWYTF